jgi:hypothetical protein
VQRGLRSRVLEFGKGSLPYIKNTALHCTFSRKVSFPTPQFKGCLDRKEEAHALLESVRAEMRSMVICVIAPHAEEQSKMAT